MSSLAENRDIEGLTPIRFMRLKVTEELHSIFQGITEENKSEYEWALVESDDMFQSAHFMGGFDATEMAFCFSYRDPDGKGYWFQLTLDEVTEFANSRSGEVEIRYPN